MPIFRRFGRLISRSGQFWTDAYVLYLAARDSRASLLGRLAAGIFAIYVISPIDLIPDPLPFIGVVDDFIIIPIGLALIRYLIDDELLSDYQRLAAERQPERPGFFKAIRMAIDTVRRIPRPENLAIRQIPGRVVSDVRERQPFTSLRRRVSRLRQR